MRLARLFGLATLVTLVAGCALSPGADAQTFVVCNRGFANDPEWGRVSTQDPEPRALRRHFERDLPSQTSRATAIWFKKSGGADFASCSKYGCEEQRCYWRVRLYARKDARWRVASEYHLADRKLP